jgi:hypothetical protein
MARSDWRTWRVGRTGPVELVALVSLALFMVQIEAFQVEFATSGLRYIYWLATIVGGGLIGAAIEPLLERAPVLAARPRWRAVAQVVVMTVPITGLVWGVSALMIHDGQPPRAWLAYFPNVLVVDMVVVTVAWLLRLAFRPRPTVGATSQPEREGNPLAEKLPPRHARATLIAIEAEDHYLRVHTTAGEALVYMRFADALDRLAADDGLRVHRSWWVACGAVETVVWRQGRGELSLSNGTKVPVSRTYAPAARKVLFARYRLAAA